MAENTTGAAYGGHDNDFIDKVADRFICQICTKVLCEPHLAVCCGQHFCESCLNKWFDRQRGKQSCPHCRAEGEGFNHVIHKGLRSEVNQLKIRCSNNGKGCKWTGELGALKTHLESESGCGFVMVKCPNKCIIFAGTTCIVLRKDIKKHLAQDCYLRPYMCEFCGFKDTYEAIKGIEGGIAIPGSGHKATCLEVPLTCPNECGSEKIKRKDMDGHRSKCPQEPVECPFAEAGCKGGILRCQLQDHMTSSIQQHLMIVMKDNHKTKIELKETQTKLDETRSELVDAKQELSEAIVRLSVTERQLDLSYKLEKVGDSITLQMPKFSEYRRSGKVWHSPPFYYREGYKMCLAVYANGVGFGAGTHVSVSLLLLRGKYDNHLKWPMTSCKERFHFCVNPPMGGDKFCLCSENHRRAVNEQKEIEQILLFSRLDTLHLVNDCLTLSVRFEGECFLQVCIV